MPDLCKGCRGFWLLTPTRVRVCVGLAESIASLAFYPKTQPYPKSELQKSIASLALAETNDRRGLTDSRRFPLPSVGGSGAGYQAGGFWLAYAGFFLPVPAPCLQIMHAACMESHPLLFRTASERHHAVLDANLTPLVFDSVKIAPRNIFPTSYLYSRCRETTKSSGY